MSKLLNLANCSILEAETVTEAWDMWFTHLKAMADSGMEQKSRDGVVVGEAINAVTIIKDPTRNIVLSPDRMMPVRYAVGELLWYLSGSNQLRDISKYSKVWNRMTDDGETLNSAYGYRIFKKFGFDQLKFVEDILKADPLTRQAVIHIKDPVDYIDKYSNDVPCTLTLQFLIRNGELNLTVHMRSNDLWTGFPYDVFSFTCFQILLAFRLGVEIGTYTHTAGSLHLYERSLEEWKRKHPQKEAKHSEGNPTE